jgi:hypothetical protein
VRNLNGKEVVKGPQIFNRKFLLHPSDKGSDDMRMCTCNNNIINIYEKENFDTSKGVKKERSVNKGGCEAKVKEKL